MDDPYEAMRRTLSSNGGNDYSEEAVRHITSLTDEQRELLVATAEGCQEFSADQHPLFIALVLTTQEVGPSDVRSLDRRTYMKILGMGLDLGRALERCERERSDD